MFNRKNQRLISTIIIAVLVIAMIVAPILAYLV